MPAASSFEDGKFMTQHANLNLANEHLQWNPHPLDREARQEVLWNRRSESPNQPSEEHHLFQSAMYWAEFYAQRLTEYYEGRIILFAEAPGRNALDPRYWLARARFYKVEYERLKEEDYNRASRSVTPAFYQPESLDETELDCAKRYARSAAENLARFPAGKAFLDAEDHGESATDPEYWRRKEREYNTAYSALPKESALERAKRHAHTNLKKLATFPAGKRLLEAEDHGASAEDPEYWRRRERYYWNEHERLRQEFWDHWKPIQFDRSPTHEPSSYSITPETSVASAPKTRLRRSSRAKQCPTTTSIRSIGKTTQYNKEINRTQMTIASNLNSCSGTLKMKGARSRERRKRKDVYRRQGAQVVATKPKPLSSEHPLPRSLPYGLATPSSGGSRSGRLARSIGLTAVTYPAGARSKSYPQSPNAFRTPTLPKQPKARVGEHSGRKATTRLKRLRDRDSTYHGSRSASQPVDPISSRLRSSGRRLHEGSS